MPQKVETQVPGTMSAAGPVGRSDVVIFYAEDAKEWSAYLVSLLTSVSLSEVLPYTVNESTSFTSWDYSQFKKCKCLLVLLSPQLLDLAALPAVGHGLQRILLPVHKVLMLLCGVTESAETKSLFRDWQKWKQVSCDDDPDVFTTAVEEAINESSSKDSGCDTMESEPKAEPQAKARSSVTKSPVESSSQSSRHHQETIVKVLPDRIKCGVEKRNSAHEETSALPHNKVRLPNRGGIFHQPLSGFTLIPAADIGAGPSPNVFASGRRAASLWLFVPSESSRGEGDKGQMDRNPDVNGLTWLDHRKGNGWFEGSPD
ncbi:phosphoinositide 3-kinase adapter protein 1-like [Mustelus asterias]